MEELLVARLKNRDETALGQLYDVYSASLYGVILRIVKDEFVAEEAMQDCFLKIWNSCAFYDSDKGRLFTWMITIARHIAIDKLRSRSVLQSRKNQNIDETTTGDLIHPSSFKPEHIGIKELMINLSADQRKVVDLLYFEGYPQMDAAKELAIPLGTVKTRLRYALQILRKLLKDPPVLAA